MRTSITSSPLRARLWRWVAVLVAVLMVGASCGDDDEAAEEAEPTTTAEVAEATTSTPPADEGPSVTVPEAMTGTEFDFATDSLCDWFSAEEMNQIVAAAQERAGTDWRLVAFEADDCAAQEPPTATRWDYAWDHTRPDWLVPSREHVNATPGLMVGLVPVVWMGLEPAEDFVGHEMLDESLTYGNLEYLCSWVEFIDFDLRVEGHGDDVLRFSLAQYDPMATRCMEAQSAALAFGVADAMLENMNWVD